MEPRTEPHVITGLARIASYEVTFDEVRYIIEVRDGLKDTNDQIQGIPNFNIEVLLKLHPKQNLLTCLKNPTFTAMQQAWETQESDCYFEHRSNDYSAFMIMNGVAALVPVVDTSFPV